MRTRENIVPSTIPIRSLSAHTMKVRRSAKEILGYQAPSWMLIVGLRELAVVRGRPRQLQAGLVSELQRNHTICGIAAIWDRLAGWRQEVRGGTPSGIEALLGTIRGRCSVLHPAPMGGCIVPSLRGSLVLCAMCFHADHQGHRNQQSDCRLHISLHFGSFAPCS